MKRPIKKNFLTSRMYTNSLEEYCDFIEADNDIRYQQSKYIFEENKKLWKALNKAIDICMEDWKELQKHNEYLRPHSREEWQKELLNED